MKETDLRWLVGLLEGEGSFLKPPPSSPNCPRISLEMTDQDVVEKAALLMGGKASKRTQLKSILWKLTYRVLIRGSRAAILMRELYPEMGARRRSQIDAALKNYIERKKGDNTRRLSEDQVRLILKSSGSTISALAREFGVSRRSIRERKSWINL